MQGLFAYPDLVVVCGALQFHDQVQDVLVNPRVIVEVLSPPTEPFDRGEKFHRYRRWLPTLTDYVLVAQDRPLLDHYHRQDDGTWALRTLEGLEDSLHLGTIGCTVPLIEVYERIVFAHNVETGDC
jgi:Uma2 family endonuclease